MNKAKNLFCLCLVIFIIGLIPKAFALNNEYYVDVEKFKQFNPDGHKYEFVQDFLVSLSYLKINVQRNEDNVSITHKDYLDLERVKELTFTERKNLSLLIY